jgi:hypothetical protein
MTYSALEDLYLLDSGRKVKRLELRVYGAPPAGVPFQWAVMSSPATALTKAERLEVATWLTTGLDLWATQDDEQADASEANAGPRLIVLDRSSGALA